ncbi:MAG: menaquinol oxidoreductase [Deltaproteobacteria bacterium RIFOXYA12_FULL_61_11]|nr:MAG: menaquinol oxidoreductase [Deltaproteobacteria bacterium RIFOXYA12_FULL_61_11]
MLEKALLGDRRYWSWILLLLVFMGIGAACFLLQLNVGLGITGMSRDVTWGFYIAQFTFLVGVAASAVMVVLPYYLHNYKAFGKMTILGEFLAISAVLMCMLFIVVDMGQPQRVTNVMLYPTPNSMMFWDMISLMGYLGLNVLISRITLDAERKSIPPPRWIKPVIILSIPWAVSIHTVTAFLYSGLAARGFWMTAILAPRFLASAFASGPSFLILLCLLLRKVAGYDVGKEPIQKLAVIITYAMLLNLFFVAMELFTTFYSQLPEHMHHFSYLFFGYHGKGALVPWMWTSISLAVLALVILLNPATRKNENLLVVACLAVFSALWIDKGLGMVVTGFIPSPLGHVQEYFPTAPELLISLAIYSLGFFCITVLYKIALSVKRAHS